MANKNRIEKLEKQTRVKANTWNPAMIEVIKGHEQDPEHLIKLADIEAEARGAGWAEAAGVYAVEVIKNTI
jgi:hypothetical protein